MVEANFDGIVGPTHNYGGLSYGNVASLSFATDLSSPKQAALQGLQKAKALSDMGLTQGVIPPQIRPDFEALRNIGFSGSDEQVLKSAYECDPTLLSVCYSSSFMWTANAATVAPSADTIDGKAHLTPANLRAKPHRAIEPYNTFKTLNKIFKDDGKFVIHPCLEFGDAFSDEGAANHTRFESSKTSKGLHFFVYGREAMDNSAICPVKYPARQTLEASRAIARVNQIKPELCYFAQQNPDVIDAGVFHNDVISVGHKNVLLYHEMAFLKSDKVISDLNEKLSGDLIAIKATLNDVSVEAAVKSYLFNSQLISTSESEMALIAPEHCRQEESVKAFIDKMIADNSNPVNDVHYFDLLQSMKNGGGPACLRLRVQMTEDEILAVNQACLITDSKYNELTAWVNKNYRDELSIKDLATYRFAQEVEAAMLELNSILDL